MRIYFWGAVYVQQKELEVEALQLGRVGAVSSLSEAQNEY